MPPGETPMRLALRSRPAPRYGDRPRALAAARLVGAARALPLLCAAAGCTPPTSGPPSGATPPPPDEPPPAAMPGPARGRMFAAVEDNARCEGCHRAIADEWRASLHQRADLEPAYRRAFAIEPLPFCRGCHAPEALPMEEEPAELGALGVGCVTCHVTTVGEVLAAPVAPGGSPREPAPHPVVRSTSFAGPAACASCHEFAFPTTSGRTAAELMQSTVREHAASASAGESCATCHMPRAPDGHRDHRFRASRDEATLRAALDASATRTSPTAVTVVLSAVGVGHAFPTGDLFRRLEVTAEVIGPDQMSLGETTRYLARHFALRQGQVGRRLVSDDRLHDGPVRLVLELGPGAVGRAVSWRVAYQRVGHPIGDGDEGAVLDGEIALRDGTLPAP